MRELAAAWARRSPPPPDGSCPGTCLPWDQGLQNPTLFLRELRLFLNPSTVNGLSQLTTGCAGRSSAGTFAEVGTDHRQRHRVQHELSG